MTLQRQVLFSDIKKARQSSFSEMGKAVVDARKSADGFHSTLFSAIDAAASKDAGWRSQFNNAFNKAYFGNDVSQYVDFKKLTKEQKESTTNFAVDQKLVNADFATTAHETGAGLGALAGIIETDILPTIDLLTYNSGILSKVTTLMDTNSKQLPEYGVDNVATSHAETGSSTPADRIPRNGDKLTADKKIQASTEISELALMSMNPVDYATLVAELLRSVSYFIEDQIFNGDNTGENFCGLLAGDATWGAIELDATYAAGPAGNPADDVDYLETIVQRMPKNLFDYSRYTFAMNNTSALQIARTRDANARPYLMYKDGGGFQSFQTGIPFGIFNSIADNKVGLFDLSLYYVIMAKSIQFKSDVADIKSGVTTVLAETYADGGIRGGYKDVESKNAHRFGTLQGAGNY